MYFSTGYLFFASLRFVSGKVLSKETKGPESWVTTSYQQQFQVPKIEVLNLKGHFGGWVFPIHKLFPCSLSR